MCSAWKICILGHPHTPVGPLLPRRSWGAYTWFYSHMFRVPPVSDAKSDWSCRGEAEVRILNFRTTWSEFQKASQTATKRCNAELRILNFKETSPLQSRYQAVVCVSTPRMYPQSGYFLVYHYFNHHVCLSFSTTFVTLHRFSTFVVAGTSLDHMQMLMQCKC